MKTGFRIPAALLGLLAAACSAPVTRYGDPRATETVTVDFGSTDLQLIAGKMVDSLLGSGRIQPDPRDPGQPPVVAVARVVNATSEHIDTKSITDKIRTALVKSGKVRFVAMEAQEDLVAQYRHQGTWADDASAKSAGRQAGAGYILRGDIASIVKTQGRTRDVYYKFTLNLVDVETAVIAWAEEQEIRKDSKRRLIGF